MIEADILIVEDEGITAKDLQSRLTRLGYRVAGVSRSGEDALEKVAAAHPDLVLMDIRLKGAMDGVQAASEIKTRFGIPVLYLTAFADEETLGRAQATAPYGYILKPFDERELHATIQMALHRHRIEQQVDLKADMVAAVSHELRGSFATVVGFTELLLHGEFGPLTPAQATHLHAMERNVQRMLELIRSLLDFSRIEQRTPLDLRLTSVADLIADIEVEIQDLPRKPLVRTEWNVEPELPVMVTDPVKLRVVMRNLIVNALKYTERGRVTVTVRGSADGVEFCVADTGPGIPAEARESVFEPFVRLRGANSDVSGGVGLGLYITRRLVELLGGTITLDSVLGQGSTFLVAIPRTQADVT